MIWLPKNSKHFSFGLIFQKWVSSGFLMARWRPLFEDCWLDPPLDPLVKDLKCIHRHHHNFFQNPQTIFGYNDIYKIHDYWIQVIKVYIGILRKIPRFVLTLNANVFYSNLALLSTNSNMFGFKNNIQRFFKYIESLF